MEQSQPEVRKLLGEEERRVIEEEDKQVVDEVEANKKMVVEKERREGRSEKGSERLRKPSKKDQVSLQFFISDSTNKHNNKQIPDICRRRRLWSKKMGST